MNRRVPVEAQLLLVVVGARLMLRRLQCVYGSRGRSLHLELRRRCSRGPTDPGTPRNRRHRKCFPIANWSRRRIRRIADPAAVVLQSAINVVGIRVIEAHVIELRNGKVDLVLPARSAVFAAPQTAVVARIDDVRIGRVNPDIVVIAVSVSDRTEAFRRLRSAKEAHPVSN